MQFTYQHRDYCQRLVLISSGGLGPDLSWILRILSAPGTELVLPVVGPRPVLNVGNKLGSWLMSAGIQSPRAGEMWSAYSSLSEDLRCSPVWALPARRVADSGGGRS
jgi:hypothetical protein